ncbi:trypsin-like peptidase domain-containing protein [Actinomycetospora chibensis]|uniref:Trypsin-like peptidase domain-containing protein n=1 Tax=Actinomycetospora chibensis TaxID=663606 RepID=A0ABV9RQM3_9PSEU|nr:trypsin-like peptidase domain-containing protein [Actinomycetospora chibensis]MDD7924966.1 trypsin-like peptidase domain-containing protein [Actinomycetospora chibensis]
MSENDAASAAPNGSGPSGSDVPPGPTSTAPTGPSSPTSSTAMGPTATGPAAPGPDGGDGPTGRPAGPGGVRWAEGTGREYDAQPGAQPTGGASPYSAPTQVTQQPQGLGNPSGAAGATAFGPMPSYPATAPQTREAPVGTYDGPGGYGGQGGGQGGGPVGSPGGYGGPAQGPPTEQGGYGWGAVGAGPVTPPGGHPRDPGGGWGGGAAPGGGGGSTPPRRRLGTLALVALALVAGLIGGALSAVAIGGIGSSSSSSQGTALDEPVPNEGPTDAAPGSIEAVAANVLPSAVQIRGAAGEGSGVVLSADGLIMTNNHVLQAGQGGGLEAIFSDGRAAPVQIVGTAPAADIAVVRASGVTNLRAASLGNSDELVQGQTVIAVGSPLGLSGTVTTGIVSALQRPVQAGGSGSGQSSVLDAIQTDAAINPGNSGGPLVDDQGRVIGVNTAIASVTGGTGQEAGSIGLGFAIPINQARRLATELVDTGQATQAVIGVGVADAQPRGAAMADVQPGSPAQTAGIVAGDVVVRVDNRVIEDANAFVAAIQSRPPGQTVTLALQTPGGAPRQVTVTLGSRLIGGR